MRTITFKLATNQTTTSDSIYTNAFSADDNTTQLVFDFTGLACETWDKWLDLTMSDMTKDVQSLGTGAIVTFNLGAEHTKKGQLLVNPYAKSGTDKHGFPIYKLFIERQLNNSTVDASAEQSMIDYFDAKLAVKAVNVTTLGAGESATASVTLATDGTTYDFGIPQGIKGDTGAQVVSAGFDEDDMVFTLDDATEARISGAFSALQGTDGVSFLWKGAYSAGTAYAPNDVVSYNGSTYICILASTGNLPTNATYFSLVAQKGDNTSASAVSNTPAGNIAATDVQAALNELDTEKASKTQEAWITPTLSNNWTERSGYPVRYMKSSTGVVHIKGQVVPGTSYAIIFTLPVGYRPAQLLSLIGASSTNGDVLGSLSILANGQVYHNSGTVRLSLDGLSFRAEQ